MAKALDQDDAITAFERFKQAVAKIAGVPKSALKSGEPKRRKRARKAKADK